MLKRFYIKQFSLVQVQFSIQKQFHSKQFSLAWLHSLIDKKFLFEPIQFSQTVLIQTIHSA